MIIARAIQEEDIPSFEAIRQKGECEKRRKRRSIFFFLLYSIYNLTMV
jgi:hypothetical protein